MRIMTLSIAPASVVPTSGDRHATAAAPSEPERAGVTRTVDRPPAATSTPSPREVTRDHRISFDETSGLAVVRIVDVATGEIVGQNPSEAYLRLAHAMLATLRTAAEDGAAADRLA